ncbi:MAG: ABC-type transport auxiliary lipoprotein family protein [Acetobacteraceae bacterium]
MSPKAATTNTIDASHPQLRRRTLLALMAAATTGCVPPRTVLTPVPGPVLTGSPMTVSVRTITLPQLLQRPEIICTSDMPAVAVPAEACWAEAPDLMIGRVLTQDLIQRLPGSRVFFDPMPPFSPADVWVDLTLMRFETNDTGDVLAQAQVSVVGLRYLTRTAWRTVTPAGGSTQALATALSIALARFSDLIATLIVESWQVQFR